MRHTLLSLVTALSLCAGGLFDAAPAIAQGEAQPTGVVLRFRGWRAAQARTAVVSAASEVLDLTPSASVESRARALGLNLREASAMGAVAADMGLLVVVTGRVVGRGARAVTELRAVDARGNEVAFREAPGPRTRSSRQEIEQAAGELLRRAVADVQRRLHEEEEARRRAEEEERRRLLAQQAAAGEHPASDEPGEPTELPVLAAFVGYGGRTRDARFDLEGGARRIYDSSLFSELSLRVELRPLAGSDSEAARGFYAQADASFAVGLSSTEETPTGAQSVDTKTLRVLLSLGYVASLAEGAVGLGALAGFGYDEFELGANTTMPSSAYPFLRVGVVGSVALAGSALGLRADAGFRYPFGVGDIADAFGDGASAIGFDVGASLGGELDVGFAYAVRFGYERYGIDFSGDALDAPALDGTDASMGFTAQLGWAFH